MSTKEIVEEYQELENESHTVLRLKNLTSSAFQHFARSSRLFILINFTSGENEGKLSAEGFSDNGSAVARYSELEEKLQKVADIVLVGASQQDAIKLAYTNYFSDASIFIAALDSALAALGGHNTIR